MSWEVFLPWADDIHAVSVALSPYPEDYQVVLPGATISQHPSA